MKVKRISVYVLAGLFASAILLGILLLTMPNSVVLTVAIEIICLCLVTGLLVPNHVSLVGLIAGICMLVFPARVVGIIFLCLGIVGILIPALIWIRTNKPLVAQPQQ